MNESIDWLKGCIRDVLDSLSWKYLSDDDVGAREVVCIFGAGDLGNWVLINRIIPQKKVLLIIATCQENVPAGVQRPQAVEFVARANFGILNGFFDMDLSDGDLRFSSRVEYGFMNRREFTANFRRTFQIVHGTFTKYLPGIAGVSKQGMLGRAAVEIVEGGANTIPDPKQNPLLAAVARHLQQASANYVCHPQKSTIRMPCTVSGTTFHLRIKAMEDTQHLYVFCNYPRNGGRVPTHAISLVLEYICRANWALPFGYFDMDLSDGELRFVTWLATNGLSEQVVQTKYMRALVVSAITTFVKYLGGIDDLVKGLSTPEEAIVKSEGQSSSSPEMPAVSEIIDSAMTSSEDEEVEPIDTDAGPEEGYSKGRTTGVSQGTKPNSASPIEQNEQKYFVDIRRPADGADSGAIDFISTRGDSKPWINPAESGHIEITCSDILEDSEPISAIVGRSAARCVTRGNTSAWITIDLLRCRLRPTAYSLKHYAASDVEALRWWKLEGSKTGASWFTLSEHKGDSSLSARCTTQSWPIESDPSSPFFRYFRISLTGPNSNHCFHLACGGIELYGLLQVDFAVEPHLAVPEASVLAPDDVATSGKRVNALKSLTHSPELSIQDIEFDVSKGGRNNGYAVSFKGRYCGVDVIVKVISTTSLSSDDINSFREYMKRLVSLSHRNLLQTIGFVDDRSNQQFLLVEESCELGELRSALRHPSVKTQLPFSARVSMALGVAKAIEYLHEHSQLHNSLSPSSVQVDKRLCPKLADVGISSELASLGDEGEGSLALSVAYCPPEVLNGSLGTRASDIYSLGMLIYEIVTLSAPFQEKRLPAAALCALIINKELRPNIPPDVPVGLKGLLQQIWKPELEKRPTATQVCSVLQSLVS